MAFSSSDTKPPPLRHLDLEALSDRELESLLFEGQLPRKRRSWRRPLSIGFAAVGILVLIAAVPEVGLPLLVGAGVLFAFVKGGQKVFSCSRRALRLNLSGSKKLTRSTSNQKLAGVCGGLAAHLDVDATLIRLAFIMGLLVTGGPPVAAAYLLLACVLPRDTDISAKERLRILRES